MAKNLVIVESPAKAKTIEKFLGKDFQVESSFGHIADLPSKEIGINVDGDFMPNYIVSTDKKAVVSKLKTQLIGGVEYSENQEGINCNVFGVPLFEPEEIEFTHEVNFELIKQLEGTTIINGREIRNVYGLIQFINEKGQTEKGRFLSLKPNGKGVWKILKYK